MVVKMNGRLINLASIKVAAEDGTGTVRIEFVDGSVRIFRGDIDDLATQAGTIVPASRGRADQHRITEVLTRLNWARLPKDRRGNVLWAPLQDAET